MKKMRLLYFAFLTGLLLFTACESDDDKKIDEAQTLVEFIESAESPLGKDYVNSDMPSIIGASEVKTLNATGQVYIIDIRSASDFNSGHIENAHNVAAADIINHLEGVDLSSYSKVAVVCYTGQTAGWAASLARLMGYDKVYSMKWGMSSWNENFNSWGSKVGNTYSTMFTSASADKGVPGELPELNTGEKTGIDILRARIQSVLNESFDAAKITSATVFGNLDNYYIVNYWPENHYLAPGHIPGAIQYTPKQSIKLSADLLTLPTDKTIVVYCYTGQTSAYMAAYLRVLGYDAKSLLFGANGMIYDNLKNAGLTAFSETQVMGYDYIAGN